MDLMVKGRMRKEGKIKEEIKGEREREDSKLARVQRHSTTGQRC